MAPFKYGALTPRDVEWQVGKTAATIAFVQDAEEYLEQEFANKEERQRIVETITELRSGERILTAFLTVQEFLSGNLERS